MRNIAAGGAEGPEGAIGNPRAVIVAAGEGLVFALGGVAVAGCAELVLILGFIVVPAPVVEILVVVGDLESLRPSQ